ncbi:MAG: hypothetical protein EOO73_28875 [Myxococcales bacterium]|nr:MAG: hypothetical protein EOO73_28875 [Myxococcales bacterium]
MTQRFASLNLRKLAAGVAAASICGYGAYYFGAAVDRYYPIHTWLLWRVAPIWGYALLLNASAVAFGALLVRRLLGEREIPALERLLQSMMLGLVAFVLALYVAGFVGLFKPWLAVALPLAFLVAGERDGRALLHELLAWRRSVPNPGGLERTLGSLALLFGGACVVFLYLEALNVSAINFDASWYHFPIAQDYARVGRIIAFPGENHRAYPHLTSMLHTWALLVPGLKRLPQHWMLSLHLEFCIVLWRLVGAAALARWMLGGRDVRGLWAAFFLFPSIFVYDQAIGGSADHFLGFFAAPALLAAARALKSFDARWCALLGAALGGHMLVKYQAAYLIFALGGATVVALVVLGVKHFLASSRILPNANAPSLRVALRGALSIALVAALVSSPHFGKNAVFYHNPFYPFAQRIFKGTTPKHEPGFYTESKTEGAFKPRYTGLKRQAWALGRVMTYSFETANRNLTKHRPYMGSLFSLLLPCLLVVRGRKRVLFSAGVATLAMMVWANTAANDRYLLGFYDLCIGTALALMVKVWDLGWVARSGLSVVVLLQLFWGGDAMLVYGKKQLDAGVSLIVDGWSEQSDDRLHAKDTQQKLTKATPANAVILSRNYKGLLGLDRLVLSDIRSSQDYVNYSNLPDPRSFYELLRARGITHLLYPRGDRRPGRWNNTLLFAEVFKLGKNTRRFSKLMLTELPSEAPPPSRPYLVLVGGQREYPDGIYRLEQLDVDYRDPSLFSPKPKPLRSASKGAAREVLAEVRAVITCRGRLPRGFSKDMLSDFEAQESFDGCEYYLRR